MKDEYLKFIKNFSKIRIKDACDKFRIDRANLYKGKIKESDMLKVKQYIESEVGKLYIMEDEPCQESIIQVKN